MDSYIQVFNLRMSLSGMNTLNMRWLSGFHVSIYREITTSQHLQCKLFQLMLQWSITRVMSNENIFYPCDYFAWELINRSKRPILLNLIGSSHFLRAASRFHGWDFTKCKPHVVYLWMTKFHESDRTMLSSDTIKLIPDLKANQWQFQDRYGPLWDKTNLTGVVGPPLCCRCHGTRPSLHASWSIC